MPMFCDITEIADTLDDMIEKGLAIKTNQQEDLRKGLTFDPFNPSTMHEQSTIYNPYKWVDDGYMPYTVDHWRALGKCPDKESYAEVVKLYDMINFRVSAFKSFSKTLDTDLIKAGVVPIGTVHTYSNGVKYKKMQEGKWAPVKDLSKPMTGHDDIESHASGVNKIQDQIKSRTKDDALSGTIKEEAKREAQKQVQEALKQVFGGEMPDALKKYFGKVTQENDMKDQENGKDAPTKLKEAEEGLKPKKHHVAVDFTHNGKAYKHEFPAVHGHSKEDVQGRVVDMIKKKLPGAVIGKIAATSKDDEKVKGLSPKQVWKDKKKD